MQNETLRRRALAALRLPPLACGCRDLDSRSHLAHLEPRDAPTCYRCSSVGLEALRARAESKDPRCACARALCVEVRA